MEQTCQMRAKVKAIISEGRIRPGSIFWTTNERGVKYIEADIAELIGPAQTKPAGPSATKGDEKKTPPSSIAAPDGRSSASASLVAPGRDNPPASSPAAKVSRKRKSKAPGGSAAG